MAGQRSVALVVSHSVKVLILKIFRALHLHLHLSLYWRRWLACWLAGWDIVYIAILALWEMGFLLGKERSTIFHWDAWGAAV